MNTTRLNWNNFFTHMVGELSDSQLRDLRRAVGKESRRRAKKDTKACQMIEAQLDKVMESSL